MMHGLINIKRLVYWNQYCNFGKVQAVAPDDGLCKPKHVAANIIRVWNALTIEIICVHEFGHIKDLLLLMHLTTMKIYFSGFANTERLYVTCKQVSC